MRGPWHKHSTSIYDGELDRTRHPGRISARTMTSLDTLIDNVPGPEMSGRGTTPERTRLRRCERSPLRDFLAEGERMDARDQAIAPSATTRFPFESSARRGAPHN